MINNSNAHKGVTFVQSPLDLNETCFILVKKFNYNFSKSSRAVYELSFTGTIYKIISQLDVVFTACTPKQTHAGVSSAASSVVSTGHTLSKRFVDNVR